jgi:hypothetical protein
LLPYIEQYDLYQEYDFAQPWDGPNNRKLAGRMPRMYAFHGSHLPGNTTANYLAVVGDETVWHGSKVVTSADVSDGSGNTIVLIENNGAGVHWMEPRDLSLADMDLQANSPAGVSSPYDDPAVAMLDGRLHRLGGEMQAPVLRALLTIGGGEEIEPAESGGWELLQDGRQRARREP